MLSIIEDRVNHFLINHNIDKVILCNFIMECFEEEPVGTFTANEYTHYKNIKAKFKSPDEEYHFNKTQFKICIKCNLNLNLNNFSGNTSGCDPFDKNGYRLKRGDCIKCNKELNKSKSISIKKAKQMGISPKAPPGTVCEISGSPNNLVFDHDHVTNTFRGWITDPINRSIGMLGGDNDDGIENILKVLNYLNKNSNKKFHQTADGKLIII